MHAAGQGHLDALIYARENGCRWNPSSVSTAAAYSGKKELLQWIKENGGKFERAVLHNAAERNFLKLFKWLKENGCPGGNDFDYLFDPEDLL